MASMNKSDTCRRYVVPKFQAAGWDDEPHRINEQVTFTDGRIVVSGRRSRRRPGKRAEGRCNGHRRRIRCDAAEGAFSVETVPHWRAGALAKPWQRHS